MRPTGIGPVSPLLHPIESEVPEGFFMAKYQRRVVVRQSLRFGVTRQSLRILLPDERIETSESCAGYLWVYVRDLNPQSSL